MEGLTSLDATKVILFLAPGAAFAIFRSFALRGFFPRLSKDDLGALVIGSAVYVLLLRIAGTDLTSPGILDRRPGFFWICFLFLVPALLGFASGLLEASDKLGIWLRQLGVRFPSPEPNAWETMFRELPSGSILMVRLADDTWAYGRWLEASVSSQLTESRDIFLSEIGSLSEDGTYTL